MDAPRQSMSQMSSSCPACRFPTRTAFCAGADSSTSGESVGSARTQSGMISSRARSGGDVVGQIGRAHVAIGHGGAEESSLARRRPPSRTRDGGWIGLLHEQSREYQSREKAGREDQPCFTTSIEATLIVPVPSSRVPFTFTGTPIWPSATFDWSSVYSFSLA